MKRRTGPLMKQSVVRIVAGLVMALAFQPLLLADKFLLRDGRVITGKLLSTKPIDKVNPAKNSSPDDVELVVEIDAGVEVTIHKSDLVLSGHRPTDEREEAYKKAAAKAQTADDHYRLAQQLHAANLRELAQAHFLRTIELNPDFTEARAAVKHKQSDSGRWIRTEDHMHRMGKIEVGAKWVYPEHAHEENLKAEQEKNVKAVKKEIQTFHQAFLKNSPKADQARAAVEQLNDPIAVEVFAEKLADKVLAGQKPIPDGLKLVYIRLLSKFESVVATDALATACVFDSNERIRNAALDVLVKNGRGQAIYRISAWLKAANNVTINRAAYALGKLEASEASLDLINALVTKHERQVSPQTDTFTPDGTSFGGPKKVMVDVRNEQVRSALAQITGQGNLGYDKVAWLAWFANVYAPPVDDLRRDF